jgi:hypothetical protein
MARIKSEIKMKETETLELKSTTAELKSVHSIEKFGIRRALKGLNW